MSDDGRPPDDPLARFLRADSGAAVFLREVLSSALAVALVGALLFAVSGVWPPMVAVESGSMEPHMERGDLVFITDADRFSPEFAHGDTGVVTYQTGQEKGYTTFGSYGSVVVYHPPGGAGPPIIHRARLHVEEGENWLDRANPDYLPEGATCEEIDSCPAPYDGFVTKGDANAQYDQVSGIAPVVKDEWVRGVARVRIPYLGYVRLLFSEAVLVTTPVDRAPDLGVPSGPADGRVGDGRLGDGGVDDARLENGRLDGARLEEDRDRVGRVADGRSVENPVEAARLGPDAAGPAAAAT